MMWVIKFILSRWCLSWQRQLLRVRFLPVAAGMEKPRDGLMSKICKQNALLCLTCSPGMASCDINHKQNHVCCFQTVNLSFSSRKRPTFASKVARFLSANSRLIVWIKKNVLSSKDKSECFSDHRSWYFMLSDSISDRTIALLFRFLLFSFNQRYKSTMQMCRRICAPPEINIRIFNPLSSFFYSTITWCRLICRKNLNVFRISVQADYGKKSECFSDHKLAALTFGSYILCCRIAYPTEQ